MPPPHVPRAPRPHPRSNPVGRSPDSWVARRWAWLRARLPAHLVRLRPAPRAQRATTLLSAHRAGSRGERQAARRLRTLGYRIVARNLQLPPAEIDLLALHGDTLVVIEVKTGHRASRAALRRRLGPAQRERLASALRWLRRTPAGRQRSIRADLALVRGQGCRTQIDVVRDVLDEA